MNSNTDLTIKMKMEGDIKSEVLAEVLPAVNADYTCNAPLSNNIKEEFSLAEMHVQVNTNTALTFKIKMEEGIKSEVNEVSSTFNAGYTSCDASHSNDTKEEFLLAEMDSQVKHETPNISSVDLKIELETLNQKCVRSDHDEIDIKEVQLLHEELVIKTEDESSHVDQTIKQCMGKKSIRCSLCDYKCSQKKTLQVHMRKHTGEKPFQCNTCGHRCKRKGDLTRHMKIHTGKQSFQCSICNYKCTLKVYLRHHIVTVQTRSYTCACTT